MFAEDLTPFFDSAEFACDATLTPGGPGTVIYDENGLLIESMNVETLGPVALCPAAQWPAAADGDALTIQTPAGSRSFVLRGVRPLDDGALKLLTLARL